MWDPVAERVTFWVLPLLNEEVKFDLEMVQRIYVSEAIRNTTGDARRSGVVS